jgi:hypothetical protein
MVTARALGLSFNDPQRGHVALHTVAGLFSLPPNADGIGVAVSVDGSVLLSRVPSVPPGAVAADLVGPLKGRCAVVQVRTADELKPHGRDGADNLGPFRARAFAGAVVGGPQDADEAAMSRDRLLADVPDFLRRSLGGQTEAEAVFFAVLARLHKKGLLDSPHPKGRELCDAIREVLEQASSKAPRHVAVTTGLEVVQVSRGMPSSILTLTGLPEAVANRVDPTLTDSSMGRERLRRFKGMVALGGQDQPIKATTTLPPGITLQSLPPDAAAIIGREFTVTLL